MSDIYSDLAERLLGSSSIAPVRSQAPENFQRGFESAEKPLAEAYTKEHLAEKMLPGQVERAETLARAEKELGEEFTGEYETGGTRFEYLEDIAKLGTASDRQKQWYKWAKEYENLWDIPSEKRGEDFLKKVDELEQKLTDEVPGKSELRQMYEQATREEGLELKGRELEQELENRGNEISDEAFLRLWERQNKLTDQRSRELLDVGKGMIPSYFHDGIINFRDNVMLNIKEHPTMAKMTKDLFDNIEKPLEALADNEIQREKYLDRSLNGLIENWDKGIKASTDKAKDPIVKNMISLMWQYSLSKSLKEGNIEEIVSRNIAENFLESGMKRTGFNWNFYDIGKNAKTSQLESLSKAVKGIYGEDYIDKARDVGKNFYKKFDNSIEDQNNFHLGNNPDKADKRLEDLLYGELAIYAPKTKEELENPPNDQVRGWIKLFTTLYGGPPEYTSDVLNRLSDTKAFTPGPTEAVPESFWNKVFGSD